MPLQRNAMNSNACAVTVVLMLAITSAGQCQTEPDAEDNPATSDTPEEITVYGQKSILSLRRELDMAQENLFDLFNSLNSDDNFDIKCEYVTPLGQRRKYHVCTPKFVRMFEADAASRMVQENAWDNPTSDHFRVKKKNELLWKEMETLVLEHPEMREAVNNLTKVKQEFDAKRQKPPPIEK